MGLNTLSSMTDVNSGKVLRHLDMVASRPDAGISSTAREAFIADLRAAVETQQKLAAGLVDIKFAPYIDLFIAEGVVRPEVRFPGAESSRADSYFAFIVRPLDQDRGYSERLICGAPILIGDTVPLSDSGILERPFGTMRFSKSTDPKSDKLVGILHEVTGKQGTIVNQDLIFDNVTWGELFEVYKAEEPETPLPIDNATVQQVTILVPRNPDLYRTEVVPIAVHRSLHERNAMCFAYGIGDRVYRGRPIINGGIYGHGNPKTWRELSDINSAGVDAWYDIQTLTETVNDTISTHMSGNLVVVALPLVGQEPQPRRSCDSESPLFMEGSQLLDMAVMRNTGSIDFASFGTGSSMGRTGQIVPGKYDPDRPVGIIDATVMTYSPNQLEQTVNDLIN